VKVGDLVKRKIPWKHTEYAPEPDNDGAGVVVAISEQNYNYVQVFFHRTSKRYTVRYDKMEVISESR